MKSLLSSLLVCLLASQAFAAPAATGAGAGAAGTGADDPVIPMSFKLRYARVQDQSIYQTADQLNSITIPGVMTLLTSMINQPPAKSSDDSSGSAAGSSGSSGDGGPPVLNLVSPVADATQAVATAVQNVAAAQNTLATVSQTTASGGKVLPASNRGSGIPNFMADPASNSVIIWDKQSHYPFYDGLIKQLDRKRDLIEISVAVIDIDASADFNWGSELQFAANGTVNGHPTSGVVGSNFPYSPTVTTASAGSLNGVTDSLSSATGKTAPFGFSPASVEGAPFSIAGVIASTSTRLVSRIRMLEDENKAHVLSRPSILTMSNIPASFTDTSTLYVPVNGTNFNNYFDVPVTTSINVLPRVVAHGEPGRRLIQLVVSADDSTQVANPTQANNNPVIQTSSVSTQAVVSENGSLLLAGTYRHEQSLQESRTPILGSIPVLGLPFKQKAVSNDRVQRYFLISPRIVDSSVYSIPRNSEVWNTNPGLERAAALLANSPVPKDAAVVEGAAAQLRKQDKEGSFPNLVQTPPPLTASAPSPTAITGNPTPPSASGTAAAPAKKKPGLMSRMKHFFGGKSPSESDAPRGEPALKPSNS